MLDSIAQGFNSFRQTLAGDLDPDSKAAVIGACAYEAARYWIGNGINRPDAVDQLHQIAEASGVIAVRGEDAVQEIIGRGLERGELERETRQEINGHDYSKPHQSDLIPVVYPFPIRGSAIPRRPWLLPGLLLRRQITILVAPPGSGKSLLTIQLAMLCTSGISTWAGWRPRGRYRVLIINSEEDDDEMQRRLWAAREKMGLADDKVEGIAFAAAVDSLVIAKADTRTKTVVRTPMLERIVNTIINGRFDIVIVDPFAETFEGDENSNSELKWAGVLWREVARRTNASVILVHHTKKYASGMAGDADAARGGSALIGIARIVSTIFTMTSAEAESFDIKSEDRLKYIRFDDAKANFGLVTLNARWFVKESIALPNAGASEPADEVGVLVPWQPPDVFGGMTTAEANAVLDKLEAGVIDDEGKPTGDPFSFYKKGGKRWAGQIIQEIVACSEDTAKIIIGAWVKNGIVEQYNAKTSTSRGQERVCIRVLKRPGSIISEEIDLFS